MRIYVDGVFDLFHCGHVRLLKRARQVDEDVHHGQITLVAGVHDDATVQSYKRVPFIPHGQRVEIVRSCRHVDEVIPHAPLHLTDTFLQQHRIDRVVHAHGENDTRYDACYAVPRHLGLFRRLDYTSDISTTDIIEKVRRTPHDDAPMPEQA